MSNTLPELEMISRDLMEKDLLLSLNKDIASVRDKKDILKLINPKIKQLFGTDNIFICFLDKAKETLNPLLRVADEKRRNHPGYEETINSNFPIHDGFIDSVLGAETAVTFDLEAAHRNRENPPHYLTVSLAAGIKRSLSKSLYHGNELIGIFTLWSDDINGFSPRHIRLIEQIADMISIVVANIIASETIQKSDKENEILLDISNELVTVKDRDDLLQFIRNTLRKYTNHDDCNVLIYSAELESFKIYVNHCGAKRSEHPLFETIMRAEYPAFYKDISNSYQPVVIDVEEGIKTGGQEMRFAYETGIKEFVGIKLEEGDKILGMLFLYSEHKNTFSKQILQILQRISFQLSSVFSSLIAHEEIQNREQEKDILLTIGKELGSVRNREDLLPVLKKQLDRFGFYNDITIAKVDDNGKTFSGFVVNEESNRPAHQGYLEMRAAHHLFPDGVFELALHAEKPVIFDVEKIAKQPAGPSYVKFIAATGTVEMIGVSLRDCDREIGVLFLFSDRRKSFTMQQLSLVQGMGNQIGTVVANILANEEIKRREFEKSVLLSLSNEIATVRNKHDLLNVIDRKLKELFSVEGFGIGLISEDRLTHSPFLVSVGSDIRQDSDFEEVNSQRYSVTDGIFDKVIQSSEPVVFHIHLLQAADMPAYARFWKKMKIELVVGVALRVSESSIGCLFFHLDKALLNDIDLMKNLLQGVCAQISIAVSNILANESILRRETEKSALLAFSNKLSSVRDKRELSQVIHTRLRELVYYDDFIVCLVDDEVKSHYAFLHVFEGERKAHPEYDKVVTEKYPVADGFFDKVLVSEHPLVFDIEEMVKAGTATGYLEYDYQNGSRQIICVPLNEGSKPLGAFFVLRNRFVSVDQSGLRLIEGISYQLSTAIANIVANMRIEQQLNEINRYKEQLEEERQYLQEEASIGYTYSDIIGSGAEMQKVFHLLSQVAFTNSSVLLLGETGTGKELVARAIHNSSSRKDKLMVKVNCAALPANLIESELFGHEKGSFTGATERRIGKFELANKGTLFLDEIGEMPVDLQVKLLRAIQEREFERVGGKTTIKTDVRIIAATSRHLQKEVAEGRFRSDLYYRLNVFPITLPPLRERKEDIPALAAHFIGKLARNAGKKEVSISQKAMKALQSYDWPGNVRELEHLLERSVLLTQGNIIKEIHLPSAKEEASAPVEVKYTSTLQDMERDYILGVLRKCNGKVFGAGGAAEVLGIPVSTLNSKMKKLGIKKEKIFIRG